MANELTGRALDEAAARAMGYSAGLHRAADILSELGERARPAGRDWPEDAADADNGSYECRCVTCGSAFTGHKRRVECKVCARPAAVDSAGYIYTADKAKAAGELLRAADNVVVAVSEVVPDEPLDELAPIFELETKRHHWEYVVECRDQLQKAIEAAERAGVKP